MVVVNEKRTNRILFGRMDGWICLVGFQLSFNDKSVLYSTQYTVKTKEPFSLTLVIDNVTRTSRFPLLALC